MQHLFSKFSAGTLDEQWIPSVAQEKWVIITADRGIKGKGQKLPQLCLEYQVTHVLMSRTIAQLDTYGRVAAFHNNLDGLIAAFYDEPGSRYSLTKTGGRSPTATTLKRIDLT